MPAFDADPEMGLVVAGHVGLMPGMLMALVDDKKPHRAEGTGQCGVYPFLAGHPVNSLSGRHGRLRGVRMFRTCQSL